MIGPFTKTGSRSFFFGRKGTKITWAKVADLKPYSIGIIRGFAYAPKFERVKNMMTMEVSSVDTGQLVKMLLRKRVDLVISDETIFWHAAREARLTDQFETVGPALDNTKRYMVVPKQNTKLARTLEKAMATFKETQNYQDILRKYGLR